MKRRLFTFALAALTIGLLGSCSKINERIDGLDKRVYDLENNKIASIEQQIATINQSIADLSTIRTNIQTLMDAKTAMGEDITKLKAADQTLEGKINDLKTYVDTELAKYATKDWANATFATLEVQAEIIADVAKLKQDLEGLDTKLDQAIANLDSSLKGWVNEQLSGYCTTAQLEAKIAELKSEIDALDADNEENKTKIEGLQTSLDALSADLADAKATIKTEYEKAIKDAIEGNNGYINSTIKNAIDAANADITALTGRVEALESDVATLKNDVAALKAMIQTVSIIPAYSNGSLKAEGGILTINCVITPKEAVESLKKENFTILTSESEVLTKSALYGTLTIAKDEDLVLDKTNGTATIKVDVSSVLPTEEDKALTVAVNVKNGISDFTTEFVPVYVAPAPLPGFQLWEGGPIFAECNVGATKPEEAGYYFWWGDTVGYRHDGEKWVSADGKGTSIKFSDESPANTLFRKEGAALADYIDANGNLKSDYDAATAHLGAPWRMMTEAEVDDLLLKCTRTAINTQGEEFKNNGDTFAGWRIKGKEDYSSNSIFLPATGFGNGSNFDSSLSRYLTATPKLTNSENALGIVLNTSVLSKSACKRYNGCSVRAVRDAE